MTNFLMRFLSSLVLAPTFLYLVFLNNIYFIILLLLIFVVSLYELKFLFFSSRIHFFFMVLLIIIFSTSFYNLRGDTELDFYYLIWIVLNVWLSDIG